MHSLTGTQPQCHAFTLSRVKRLKRTNCRFSLNKIQSRITWPNRLRCSLAFCSTLPWCRFSQWWITLTWPRSQPPLAQLVVFLHFNCTSGAESRLDRVNKESNMTVLKWQNPECFIHVCIFCSALRFHSLLSFCQSHQQKKMEKSASCQRCGGTGKAACCQELEL